MAISGRQWGLFAAGLLLGGAGVALVLSNDDAPRPAKTTQRPAAAVLGAAPAAPASAAVAPVVTAEHRAACDGEPLLRAAGAADGQLTVPEETAGKSIEVAEKSIVAGKEVAAAGRVRDAEIAFLVACRIAAQAERPLTLAEAKYHLARHYAQVANEPAGEDRREELRERAETLYTAALALFGEKLGAGHEKARFAANGLQALKTATVEVVRAPPLGQQTAAAKPKPPEPVAKTKSEEPVAQAKPPEPVAQAKPQEPVAKAKPQEPAAEEVVVAKPAPAKPARRSAPSFDCGKARSAAEKAICADEELAQADRALGRLHARAKAQAADGSAFQRRSDDAWRWREANCGGDRECLREWYEQRREELAQQDEE